MQGDNRPLYSLTVEEFRELSRMIAEDNIILLSPSEPKEKTQSDILYLEDVKQLTGYKDSTVYSKVCRKEIPVISSGRPLSFSRAEITQWIIDGRPTIAEMKAKNWSYKS
jgi:predicted DNA-binding transcriptional regulator AlpA